MAPRSPENSGQNSMRGTTVTSVMPRGFRYHTRSVWRVSLEVEASMMSEIGCRRADQSRLAEMSETPARSSSATPATSVNETTAGAARIGVDWRVSRISSAISMRH